MTKSDATNPNAAIDVYVTVKGLHNINFVCLTALASIAPSGVCKGLIATFLQD